MLVKEILKLSAIFLDKKDVLEDEIFLDELPQGYISNAERQKDIETLLLCFNLIYNEIARDYLPLYFVENVTFNDFKFEYCALQKTLLDIFSLKSNSGKNIKFKMYPTYIFAKAKDAVIEYSYEPSSLSYDDEIENFSSRIPARVFAYGVAMEYAFLKSLSTEALIWEQRYKQSLLDISRKKSSVILPARRWI